MAVPKAAVAAALVIALLAFLAAPNGPAGAMIWPEPNDPIEPTGAQLPLLMLLGVFEALAMGVGIAYWIWGRKATLARLAPAGKLAGWAHISAGWFLANWWLHDNLHIINGLDLNGLIAIEYAFHVTLIAAGTIVMLALVKTAGAGAGPGAKPTA